MTRVQWVLVVGLLAPGCDAVFGFDVPGGPVPDAAVIDAKPDGLDGLDAPPCLEQAFTGDVLADTMLIRDLSGTCNPSNRQGHFDTMFLGQSIDRAGVEASSRVLMRLRLTSEAVAALTAEGANTSASLRIGVRPSGGACSGTCPNAPTTFRVFAANNDWNEGNGVAFVGAGWCNRLQGAEVSYTPWQVPGADGPEDRGGIPLATFSVDAAAAATGGVQDVPLTIDATTLPELRSRASGDELSLLLVPVEGGTLYLYAREAIPTASQLTIRTCGAPRARP